MVSLQSYLIGALILIVTTGCGGSTPAQSNEIRFKVYHYKVPCVGVGLRLCFQITKNEGEPEYFYDEIEGFDYKWGFNYEIIVEQTAVAHQMEDASSFTYKLKEVVKKEKVPAEEAFEIPVSIQGNSAIDTTNGTCSFFGEITIRSEKYSCADLAKAKSAVFKHGEDNLLLLELK